MTELWKDRFSFSLFYVADIVVLNPWFANACAHTGVKIVHIT